MMMLKALLVVGTLGALAPACVHASDEEKRKAAFEEHAEDRLHDMERNVAALKKRSGQLLGEPRQKLDVAVSSLEGRIDTARAELKELEARGTATWLDKKELLDRKLYDMDGAYSRALGVLEAH